MNAINLSWDEDIDDLLEWCKASEIVVNEVSEDDLANMDSKEFVKTPAFTNTEVVSKHLVNLGKKIVDTYEPRFMELFGRKIWKGIPDKFPVFVKPCTNDKAFDGVVVNSLEDLAEHLEKYDLNISDFDEFYLSEVVKFVEEKRMLIGRGLKYNREPDWIPQEFIDKLLECAGKEYFTVDVGLVDAGHGELECKIVEVNPPYSIDSHDIHIDTYMRFCMDFFGSLRC